jgi:hypothetical protein
VSAALVANNALQRSASALEILRSRRAANVAAGPVSSDYKDFPIEQVFSSGERSHVLMEVPRGELSMDAARDRTASL